MTFEIIVSILLSVFAILLLAERASSKKAYNSQSEEIAALKKEIANLSAAALRQIKAINEAQNKRIEETSAALSNKVSRLSQSLQQVIIDNDELKKENRKLRKQLAFYTGIDAESEEINNTEDSKKTEELLESIDLGNEFAALDNYAPTDDGIYTPESGKSSESRILDDEQVAALSLMLNTNDNLFITGKAGTGKSFLLSVFVRQAKKKVLVLAPTGISALNVGGATLHSTFGYNNLERIDVDDIHFGTIALNSEKRLVLQEVDTIVIDEISMVRSDTLDKIDRILRAVNYSDELFGGKQMILFGDLFQLPPIANKNEEAYLMDKYGGIFFFLSIAYQTGQFRFIELTINHRQKDDQRFFEILNRVREGNVTTDDIRVLNERKKDISGTRRILTLFPKKADAESVNQAELEKIQGREYIYHAEIVLNKCKIQNPNLEKNFPITKDLKLKVGALVMMVANDQCRRWVNGTMGIVKKLEADAMQIAINGRTYEVFKERFTQSEAKIVNGRITYEAVLAVDQYPVVLAYAITIHKSQGMTYPRLACDVSRCFASGQAYVALSRCASLDGLYLINGISSSALRIDRDVQNFYLSQRKLLSTSI